MCKEVVTCDKCGVDIVHYNEWLLSVTHWEKDAEMFTSWNVELCEKCNKVFMAMFEKFVLATYPKD